jgi:kynurenine formamidase
MRNLGVVFTELCDLELLAGDCAADRRHSFMYVAAPIKIHRATGAPVNPIAIK